MPCYTIKEISTNLAASNKELLIKALERANYSIMFQDDETITARNARHTITIEDGMITVSGADANATSIQEIASRIKASYATEVVNYAAKRYGFTRIQEKNNPAKSTLKRKY